MARSLHAERQIFASSMPGLAVVESVYEFLAAYGGLGGPLPLLDTGFRETKGNIAHLGGENGKWLFGGEYFRIRRSWQGRGDGSEILAQVG